MHNPADENKWALLQEMPFLDARNPQLRMLSAKLWDVSLRRPLLYLKLAHAVARDGITYASDIKQFGSEDIAGVTRSPEPDDAVDAYVRGHDDCDAKARLFVALALIRGFEARLWPLWKDGVLTHVAGEVRFNGRWHHVETILARARFDEFHTTVPREVNGKWRMS